MPREVARRFDRRNKPPKARRGPASENSVSECQEPLSAMLPTTPSVRGISTIDKACEIAKIIAYMKLEKRARKKQQQLQNRFGLEVRRVMHRLEELSAKEKQSL
ncbi:hypothetical protein KEM54_000894 [Ascosphaera aggregata]|nr:hypothetical protein KEM54_000894 [Ascosphaera aggregata]